MNVYDFDGTIYNGDCTIDFYFYCLKNNKKILKALPLQIGGILRYKLHLISKTTLKECFFSFLRYLNDVDQLIVTFSEQNQSKIKQWYLKQKKEQDVIISASPEFLVSSICCTKGITNIIASDVNKRTGKFCSANCWGIEKITRFKQKYPLDSIDQFYSDSKSDYALAKYAKNSFYVKKEHIKPWNEDII